MKGQLVGCEAYVWWSKMVMVWREIFSHVEGMVGRACRVWMTVQLFAPSPVMLCESSGKFGEQWHDNISLTHYLWSGAGVWTVWIYKWLTCASKHVCCEVLVLIFPLCPCELRTSLKSMDTWLSKASVIMRPSIWLSRSSEHVNHQILLQAHTNDRALIFIVTVHLK